jgi:hypothetical protein
MRDNPELFKVVDDTGKNIITDFKTQLDAQKYIDYHLFVATGTPEPPAPAPSPQPSPVPPSPPQTGLVKGPYPSVGGKEYSTTTRGPTTRHYASGKPDDETIEKNAKGIKDRNHQFIVYVTMHEIEHDDNISMKLGGTHMGSGWFDQGVSFEQGRCCLGKEEEHPSTQACVIKGPSIGSVLKKKVGVCATYYADQNFCELFTDVVGDGTWVKQMEAKDIGGFNPNADEFECQCRIDGFTKGSIPTFHVAVVQPIAGRTA